VPVWRDGVLNERDGVLSDPDGVLSEREGVLVGAAGAAGREIRADGFALRIRSATLPPKPDLPFPAVASF